MCRDWTKLNYAVHPGEILKEYLEDAEMTQVELAKKIGMNKTIVNEIINGKRPITMKTAIKLEKAFSFEARFWGNLQMIYDEAIERLRMKNIAKSSNTVIILGAFNNTEVIIEHTTETRNKCINLDVCAA